MAAFGLALAAVLAGCGTAPVAPPPPVVAVDDDPAYVSVTVTGVPYGYHGMYTILSLFNADMERVAAGSLETTGSTLVFDLFAVTDDVADPNTRFAAAGFFEVELSFSADGATIAGAYLVELKELGTGNNEIPFDAFEEWR